MNARTIGLLTVGTLALSTCASMKLAAKDIESNPTTKPPAQEEKVEVKKARPHMDLAFCIDTTGSMQGEIDMVKTKVKELVAKLCSGKPAPIVRVGLVAFRDRGDEYVTKLYPFTDDIDKFVKDISELKAGGGGDGPEAVNEALHASVDSLSWDKSNKTAKLLFLIGDATPHIYPNDFKWETESKGAIAKGIQINTIACNGLESYGDGVEVFKTIAKLSDGTYESLAYREVVTDGSGRAKTIIRSGGASYEVSSASADEWKKGAKELSREGKAKAVASYPVSGRLVGGRTRAATTLDSFAPMASMSAAPAPAGGSAGYGDTGGFGAVNRKDSNLDTVMYDAAMKKAREKLEVHY